MLRQVYLSCIKQAFKVNPVVAILGPRQCGKTTLAKAYADLQQLPSQNYFDLEDSTDLSRLTSAKLTFSQLKGLIIIDEIQKQPELFSTLRVTVDNTNRQQPFLILGSASRELIKQSSETLAGRITYLELTPFSFAETHDLKKLWLRGGFPLSYLAENDVNSFDWRQSYIKTYLEQDIPNLGIHIPPQNLRRFWMMLCAYHANIFNASELGRSLGISHKTVKHYLDILSGTFMVRQLSPWFENINKRQVKSPKIYIRDAGILHALLGLADYGALLTNPKLGASWEGFALEEVIRHHQVDAEDCYFWATQSHAELDLLIIKQGKKLGFEFKYTDSPRVTKSMGIALDDLQLDQLTVIYPGQQKFNLNKHITAVGLEEYLATM